jgi:hypothetical protein
MYDIQEGFHETNKVIKHYWVIGTDCIGSYKSNYHEIMTLRPHIYNEK